MDLLPYSPNPVPASISPEVREYIEVELAKIEFILNILVQEYTDNNP